MALCHTEPHSGGITAVSVFCSSMRSGFRGMEYVLTHLQSRHSPILQRASGSEHLAAFSLEFNHTVFMVLILMANFLIMEKSVLIFYIILGIDWVAHLVRAWSLYTKAAD